MSGYVGTIKDQLWVGRNVETVLLIGERNKVAVRINDVRKSTESTEHKLGVCLQPVFMHADWPQFVQFFEYWLEEGATKFYIYWESYTDEVKRVINFYKEHSRVEIQLIEWSKLPTFSSNPDTDPNFYWYRLEAFMAIFDCMHQARWNVHFVAQSDLDEMFYVTADKSLLNYLHWLEFRNPTMASVNFVSRRVRVPNYWDRISSPRELNFSPFLETELESQAFKRPLYMKNIYIPERVKRFDIHFQRETEEISQTSSLTYSHLNASVHNGMVLHLRRTDSIFSWTGSKMSRELVMLANRMERNYLRRLAADQTGLCEFFIDFDFNSIKTSFNSIQLD
ncbi:protein of unknown function DUF23 domain-containing protein [Aphelenchoides bicaudatus]|nr:protein of unknown function DUF23 domain-containing protein [Aphelenchoides bicaudatus]